MDVDALNAKGKGQGKAGVEGWNRDPKENGKPSCAHCGRRLIGQHTESDCWCNRKNPSPEVTSKAVVQGQKEKVFLGSNNNSRNHSSHIQQRARKATASQLKDPMFNLLTTRGQLKSMLFKKSLFLPCCLS